MVWKKCKAEQGDNKYNHAATANDASSA